MDYSLFDSQPGAGYTSVSLEEQGYKAQNIIKVDDIRKGFRLRKRVFCDELNWLDPENNLEIDSYDRLAVPFGVFNDNRLEAYLRLLPNTSPFMLDEVFPELIRPGYKLRKKPDTAEISRLCIERDARRHCIRNKYGVFNLSLFLYKAVYHWCTLNKVRYLYMTTDFKCFRLLTMQGINCTTIGNAVNMFDGGKMVAAITDWRKFEKVNSQIRPELFKWFTEN